jgi:hypothetical protein
MSEHSVQTKLAVAAFSPKQMMENRRFGTGYTS